MATVTRIMDVLLFVQFVACDMCIGLVILTTRQVTAPKITLELAWVVHYQYFIYADCKEDKTLYIDL